MNSYNVIKISLLLFFISSLQLATAQSPSLSPAFDASSGKTTGKTTGITKSQQVAKAKQEARAAARPATSGMSRTEAAANMNRKGTVKTVYGYLYQNNDGTVMLDNGNEVARVMKEDKKTAYNSIIGALNYLSSTEKWRVMHNYDVTNSNPRPSFLLIRQVKEE